ncbi:MAG: transcriptional repressor LexA [Myxococcales bacterium]|nr:transcriptional repressor LexA [Myxococcales bacterium]
MTKRQRETFEFIRGFLEREGYAPSLEEIASHFGLSSVATVHKHVQNLVEKRLLRKAWNRSRSLELVEPAQSGVVQVPLLGSVAAGVPIEAVETSDSIQVPEEMVGTNPCYALRVRGDSMSGDHILDGDVVLLEPRTQPREGETVVALIDRLEVTLKRFHREGDKVRLMPANPDHRPMEFPAQEVEIQGVVVGLVRRY